MRISASFDPSHSHGVEAATVYADRLRGRLRYPIREPIRWNSGNRKVLLIGSPTSMQALFQVGNLTFNLEEVSA